MEIFYDASEDKPNIVICMTCKNSELTIGYTLESIVRLNYPHDKISIIVVDAGSRDNTVNIIRKVLNETVIRHEIIVQCCNIPEGRNICIKRALAMNADFVLFIDSDIVISNKDILEELINLGRTFKRSIISTAIKFLNFKNLDEAISFAKKICQEDINNRKLRPKPVSFCFMGFTLIPREIISKIKFDEEATFMEDILYCYNAWSLGYPIFISVADVEQVFDLNLPRTNMFLRISLKDLLKGLKKKAIALLYELYKNNTLETIFNIFKCTSGKRMIYHNIAISMLMGSIVLFSIGYLYIMRFLLLGYAILTLTFLFRLIFLRNFGLLKAIALYYRFQIFYIFVSIILLFYMVKKRKEFNFIHKKIQSYKGRIE